MKKIFTLAAAVLASFSLWSAAVVPSAVWSVGDAEQLSTWGWTNKSQTASVYESGDTIAISAYLAYQSVSKQLWIGYNSKGGSSSTETAWDQIQGFGGAAYYGVKDSDGKYLFATTNAKDPRDYHFHVTNCSEVYVYGNAGSSGRNIELKAFELDAQGNPAATAAQSATYGTTSNGSFGITGLDVTKSYRISVKGDNNSNCNFYEICFVAAPKSPSLKAITIAGVEATINQDNATITAELPFGTIINDAIDAAVVTVGGSATGYAIATDHSKLTVTDGTNSKEYTFNLTVADNASTDATLKSLALNGVAVTLAENVFEYDLNIPYCTEVLATFEVNDATAIAQADYTVAGKVTVTVAAQAGNEQPYVVNYTILAAEKVLNEIVFSNGYLGYNPVSDPQTNDIYAFYLEGEDAPSVQSCNIKGASWSVENDILTITGEDNTTEEFPLHIEAVTPVAFSADKISFVGTEAWVKAPYGFADGTDNKKQGFLFSKTDSDFSREKAGKTHVEMFLPACDTIVIFAGDPSTERDVKFFINGVQFGDKTKLVKTGVTLVVEQNAAFMLTVASAQTGGDGGIGAIRMAKKSDETALEGIEAGVKAVKVVRNGQLYILKGDVLYNALGAVVK